LSKFIYDMIHMTEGEKLIHYWWLWLGMIVMSFSVILWKLIKKKEENH